MTKRLATTIEVIDWLGGNKNVAGLLGTTEKAVGNWRYSGKFPAHTFIVLAEELDETGAMAPISLWAMTEPKRRLRKN